MRTIILLSGGLDSALILAGCVKSDDQTLALAFHYGQPHQIELDRAKQIADYYEVPFEIVAIPNLPKINDVVFAGRNLVFASIAIATAQARGFDRVAIGCNASDWHDFADCRPNFWKAVEQCAGMYGVRMLTPLIYHTKRDVLRSALELEVPIDLTWSCYGPGPKPCGQCLACKIRKDAECFLSPSI